MGRHNLQEHLQLSDFDLSSAAQLIYGADADGNRGHVLQVKQGDPTASETGYLKGALAIDVTNGTVKYNSGTYAEATWSAISATGSSLTLDGAFENGKVIDGALSQATAVRIGDGTDYAGIYALKASSTVHIEANSDSTIELDPNGGAGTGTVNINGSAVVDVDLAVTGTLTAGTFSVSTLDVTDLTNSVTLASGKSLTMTGTGGSNILVLTAGDQVLSDGSLTITDADNASTLDITNNTITDDVLIDVTSTSLTTGTGLRMTADGLTSGTMVLLDSTVDGWSGGYYLRCFDGDANDLTIGQYGAVTIVGNPSTDVLTLTSGDLQVDDGKVEIDTDEDDTTYVKRNQASVTGVVVEIEATNASDDQACLLLDHNGTGAAPCMTVDHEGTADCITITSNATAGSLIKGTAGVSTGTVFEAIGAASATVSLQTITNGGSGATGWLGADGVGMLHLSNDGNLAHANASCLLIEYSGGGAATGLGTSLRIVDTGSTSTSFAAYISAATGEALKVDAGECTFDEAINLGGGFKTVTGEFTLSDSGADSMDIDGGAANDTLNIGSSTDTDVVFHGTTGDADVTWDASADALTFAATAGIILPMGTGSEGAVVAEGSLWYETDAKKLAVYDGSTWNSVSLT